MPDAKVKERHQQRLIPIEELHLHARPSVNNLIESARALEILTAPEDPHVNVTEDRVVAFRAVAEWLVRVAKIKEPG